MRLFTKNVAVLTLAAGVALAGAGCEKSRDELRAAEPGFARDGLAAGAGSSDVQ